MIGAGLFNMKAISGRIALSGCVLIVAATAQAAPGLSIGYGEATGRDVAVVDIGYTQVIDTSWAWLDRYDIEPQWMLSAGHMASNDALGDFDSTWTATLQLALSGPITGGGQLFWEIGTGPSYLSDEKIELDGERFDLGNRLLFRSYIGLGAFLDPQQRVHLVYRLQHSSNAHLADVNPGINVHMLYLGYTF